MGKYKYTQKTLWDYITGLVEVRENWKGQELELIFKGVGLLPDQIAWGLYNTLPVFFYPFLVGDVECKLEVKEFDATFTYRFTMEDSLYG